MFTPQFLITPYEVKTCPGLRPTDGDVYAIIYWFENLKDGKCTAANETIAEILGIDARTVRAALDRLERKGFIERVYEDPETRKIRKEIKCLVAFTRISPEKGPIYTVKSKKLKKKDLDAAMAPGAIIPVGNDELEEIEETPREYAKRFFDMTSRARVELVDEICASNPAVDREALISEVKKFVAYWTEPNGAGTKQLWQTKPTFEVKRRLYTWLGKAGRFAGMSQGSTKRTGAGMTV